MRATYERMKSMLVQTRIPKSVHDALRTQAEKSGITIAALVRQIILSAIGFDGRGVKVKK